MAMVKKDSLVKDIVEAFQEADEDLSGTLSLKEFQSYLSDEKVKMYFMSLDIDVTSAEKVFKLLDKTEWGEVQLEAFVEGCLEYRGSAKMIDFALLWREHHELALKLDGVLDAAGLQGAC
eukprot:CAMPEP_0180643636 /NCGR_PEP_ID=MMETSP1037_2-20121125/47933_1 /TAXON_ID=632150 /ORGANISM="Azadinium spinosum, Strain 3D9" /LENGTH=119 /DNA_ID=CAMNT_0022667183 /DNA_START=383 /DNA_END=742 /DNA_ORIENTATION=+